MGRVNHGELNTYLLDTVEEATYLGVTLTSKAELDPPAPISNKRADAPTAIKEHMYISLCLDSSLSTVHIQHC